MLRSGITREMVLIRPKCPKCVHTMSNDW